MTTRVSKTEQGPVRVWKKNWVHFCKSRYLQVSPDQIDLAVKIAAIICLVPKGERKRLFYALSVLLVGEKRKRFWESAIKVLPHDSEELVNFSRTIMYYEKLSKKGHFQSLKKGRINPATVIEAVLEIGGAYRQYLDLYRDSFYTYPAKIFSQELIQQAGKKLRGRFGDFSDRHDDFYAELQQAVETHEG